MSTTIDKKGSFEKDLIPLRILYILNKYTDEDHPIQGQTSKNSSEVRSVQGLLESEFGIVMDRKAIMRHLRSLVDSGEDLGFEVECNIDTRMVNGEPQDIYKDFYLAHKFDKSELRFLIDCVLFSKHIPAEFARDIVDRLKDLGGDHCSRSLSSVAYLMNETYHTNNKILLNNVDLLGDAIRQMHRVSFTYNEYLFDDASGKAKLYPVYDRANPVCVSPYQLLIDHEIYYLLAKEDGEDGISHFRVDLMSDIKELSGTYTSKSHTDLGAQSIQEYLSSHTFMSEGSPISVVMKVDEHVLGSVLRDFGNKARIYRDKNDEGKLIVSVRSAVTDIMQWVLIRPAQVEILKPQELRSKMQRLAVHLIEDYTPRNEFQYNCAIQDCIKHNFSRLNLEDMDLSNEESYKKLTEARTVTISNCAGVDFECFANFQKCRKLFLMDTTIPSLDFVAKMPLLNKLYLENCRIENLSYNFLGNPNLKRLNADTASLGSSFFYLPLALEDLVVDNNTDAPLDYRAVWTANSIGNASVTFMKDGHLIDMNEALSDKTNSSFDAQKNGVFIV